MFVVRWGGGMGLVTLCFVRGLFSCVVFIDRFLRTFVSFSVFRTFVSAVCLSVCPGDFLILRCCFVVRIY